MTESLEARLRHLEQERDEADRRYNEALTELDRAVPRPPAFPDPVLPLDPHQLAALNEAWNILPAPPSASGLKQKLTGLIWRTVGPYLQRQLTFNSLLVDHLNRNAEALNRAHERAIADAAALRAQMDALAAFHGRMMVYLQQITAYVDTKQRHSAGGALVLNAALSSVADGLEKRWESLDVRFKKWTASLVAAQESLKTELERVEIGVGVSQQASQSLKRELERILAVPPTGGIEPASSPAASATGTAFSPALDSYKYVGFEDRFRGSREVIRERLESYVPFFAGAQDVLDVGCGRGEFLEVLAGDGISARGIDSNHEMVELCRSRGLDATESDAVGYLAALPDGSLGGIFAAQVVEHLPPAYLLRFLELAFHKVRPGGRIVLETLNPACWVAFFESYIRDITHVWPLHPETLQYLVYASGFSSAQIEYRSPVPKEDKLQPLVLPGDADDALAELVNTFNANVEKLNARMFTHMDYAVVARRSALTSE